MRDKRTDNPCCLERRALPGTITRHFDQEPRLPGLVDAKGIASSRNLFNLQPSKGSEQKLSSVPGDIALNKACTSTLHTCTHLSSLTRGTYLWDNTAARARVRGADEFGNLSVKTRVFGPNTASIQAP